MRSSFGKKAERTKKCRCDNPKWSLFDYQTSRFNDNFTFTLWCRNCDSLWDTKSLNQDTWDLLNNEQKQSVLKVLNEQREIQFARIKNIQEAINDKEKQIVSCHKKADTLAEKIFYYSQQIPKQERELIDD